MPSRGDAFGREGEAVAAAELERRGFRLLARRHLCRGGEIDLVALEGECLCFVEVRSRHGASIDPLETVSGPKRRRVVRAAQDWLVRHPDGPRAIRFDVVAVRADGLGSFEVELVKDAFDAGE
ncbi:MAG: YraN family protein [Deltaproteobacteria bacterium]